MGSGVGVVFNRLSRHGILIRDFAAAAQRMNAAFLPQITELEDKTHGFALSHAQVPVHSITINAVAFNRRLRIQTPPFVDFYCVHFSVGGTCDYRSGRVRGRTDPQHVYISGADGSFQQELLPGYRQVTLKVPRRTIERFLVDELRSPLAEPLVFAPEPVALGGELEALLGQVDLVGRIAGTTGILLISRIAAQFERTMLALILASLPSNYRDRYRCSAQPGLPAHVARADAYIGANLRHPISLDDLVVASGVSRRTVTLAFRKHLSMSPMSYLRARRLQLARDALMSGAERGGTVTDVALACGFTHLSKFARDYNVAFGETPSQTLRRSRGLFAGASTDSNAW